MQKVNTEETEATRALGEACVRITGDDLDADPDDKTKVMFFAIAYDKDAENIIGGSAFSGDGEMLFMAAKAFAAMLNQVVIRNGDDMRFGVIAELPGNPKRIIINQDGMRFEETRSRKEQVERELMEGEE